VNIQGLHVRYLETDGKSDIPLIILHGWGSQAERWRKVLAILERQNVRALAIDLPGFGETLAPKTSWDIDDYGNFVHSFIKALAISKFYILGHSFGGSVAMKLASAQTEGMTRLILVNAAGVTPRDKKRLFAYKVFVKIMKLIFVLPPLSLFRNKAKKIIYWLSGSYDYYLQTGVMKETFKKVIERDLTPYLSKIQVPTHIIWGENDRMTPLSDAHLMEKNIAGSKLTVIKGGVHALNIQMPETLTEEIYKIVK